MHLFDMFRADAILLLLVVDTSVPGKNMVSIRLCQSGKLLSIIRYISAEKYDTYDYCIENKATEGGVCLVH